MSKLDYCFSNDYMVLRPDKAGAFDLLHVLFSSKVGRNRAIDCFTSTEIRKFSPRWAFFVSLLLQMILLLLRTPMVLVGAAVEFILNLFSNILQGKLELPDKTSSTYRSIMGFIDPRIELDKNIRPTDNRYHAALCVMASKVAYENEAFIRDVVTRHWQMEFLQFYNCWNEFQNDYTAQAFTFCDKPVDAELIVVAFRGTKPFDTVQWCTNTDPSWYKIPRLGRAHAGFTNALGLQRNIGWPKWIEQVKGKQSRVFAYYTIREALRDLLESNSNARFLVTGHGAGGALAILFPTILAYHKERAILDRLGGVYTFGQPRVGDVMLGMFVERHLDRPKKRHFRITYANDSLPRLPNENSGLLFVHFGLCLHFNSFYKLKVIKEIPGENSFSPLNPVTRHINSAWELIRSFYLGYWRNVYCKEGWLLLFMRTVALLVPGLSLHTIQDYVNSIVLGAYLPKEREAY